MRAFFAIIALFAMMSSKPTPTKNERAMNANEATGSVSIAALRCKSDSAMDSSYVNLTPETYRGHRMTIGPSVKRSGPGVLFFEARLPQGAYSFDVHDGPCFGNATAIVLSHSSSNVSVVLGRTLTIHTQFSFLAGLLPKIGITHVSFQCAGEDITFPGFYDNGRYFVQNIPPCPGTLRLQLSNAASTVEAVVPTRGPHTLTIINLTLDKLTPFAESPSPSPDLHGSPKTV